MQRFRIKRLFDLESSFSSSLRNRRNYSTSNLGRRKSNFCAKVKNSRATLLISPKLPCSMHGIFDWRLKVGIVPTLEFRFPVPLERVEDLILEVKTSVDAASGWTIREQTERNVYLLISALRTCSWNRGTCINCNQRNDKPLEKTIFRYRNPLLLSLNVICIPAR